MNLLSRKTSFNHDSNAMEGTNMIQSIRPTIYLDMDGVLTDFVSAVAELFDYQSDIYKDWRGSLRKNKVDNPYSIEGVLGIASKELWYKIEEAGIDFWAEMSYYGWAMTLHEKLQKYGDVIILTSPSKDPISFVGKVLSLQYHFGLEFRDFILCPSQLKYKLVNNTSILIDDSEENVRKFGEAGGHAILFPQPWNTAVPDLAPVSYIESKIVSTIEFINITQGDEG